jgi:hypothetical protein
MGRKVGMDFHGSLAALNGLAGTDEILVHRYEVKGKAVEISMVDEGLLTRPRSLAPAN